VTNKVRVIESFRTKYGYSVSLGYRGEDLVLTAHNGSRYFEFLLGPGDASRLAGALAGAASGRDQRGRTRKKLTIMEGGNDGS
jgi:hypothetical protein